jgi:hypothetical protein
MIEGLASSNSAVVPARVLMMDQFPEPLPSGLGSTDVFLIQNVFPNESATIRQDAFLLNQYPAPLKFTFPEVDLPGGFRKQAIINGEANPLNDLASGIVQIDGVKVLFDMKA